MPSLHLIPRNYVIIHYISEFALDLSCLHRHTHTQTQTFFLPPQKPEALLSLLISRSAIFWTAQLRKYFNYAWMKSIQYNFEISTLRKRHMDDKGSFKTFLMSSCSSWLNPSLGWPLLSLYTSALALCFLWKEFRIMQMNGKRSISVQLDNSQCNSCVGLRLKVTLEMRRLRDFVFP